jgi:hypothetical protein
METILTLVLFLSATIAFAQAEKEVAIVRHNLAADVLDNGKTNAFKTDVTLFWQKEKSQWKLIARQAYKLS